MQSYLSLLSHVMTNGSDRNDRTGVGTRGVFGYQWRHKMSDGFPLLTTKKIFFKAVVVELCWFLRGDTNIKYLHDHGVTIWDEWADEFGNLGPVYGKQWRDFGGVDQIKNMVNDLCKNPFSRRHIVSAWNPVDVPQMKLPPCHTLWQCYVGNKGELSIHLYARSIDAFLGLPFNIASYALLLELLRRVCGLEAGELIISFGDLHIYKNHFEQVGTQLLRDPKQLPTIGVSDEWDWVNLDTLKPEHVTLYDYDPHPAIKAPVAV